MREIDLQTLSGGDSLGVSFTDDRGKPGMIAVLTAGQHHLGSAPWNAQIYSLDGLVSTPDGKLIDDHTSLSLRFAKGEAMILIVHTNGLNVRYPVTVRVRPADK